MPPVSRRAEAWRDCGRNCRVGALRCTKAPRLLACWSTSPVDPQADPPCGLRTVTAAPGVPERGIRPVRVSGQRDGRRGGEAARGDGEGEGSGADRGEGGGGEVEYGQRPWAPLGGLELGGRVRHRVGG